MGRKSVVNDLKNLQNGFFGGCSEGSITGTKVLTSADCGKMWVCSGTTADYSTYLPKPSDCAGKMIGFRMSPTLTKLVTIDAQSFDVKTGTVQVWTGTYLTLFPVSGWSMSFPSEAYTGTNWKQRDTANYVAVRLGDRVNWDDYDQYDTGKVVTNYSRYVATLDVTNTNWSTFSQSFTWAKAHNGTVTDRRGTEFNHGNVDKTGIEGTGTAFLTDLVVGGLIGVGGEFRTVTWIGDDTHCAVSDPFTNAGSGLSYYALGTAYATDGLQKRIMHDNEVAILYSDGYKWTKIAGKSIPMSATLSLSADAVFNVATQTTVPFDTIKSLCGPSSMVNLANRSINLLRPGLWDFDSAIQFNQDNATVSNTILALIIRGLTGWLACDVEKAPASSYGTRKISIKHTITAPTDAYVAARYDSGSSALTLKGYASAGSSDRQYLSVTEIPTW